MIDLSIIDQLTGGKLGTHDTVCPECSHLRIARNQRKAVLRIWRLDDNFAGYVCAHCGASGYVRGRNGAPVDHEQLARARMEAAERRRQNKAERLHKALWLWTSASPAAGTIAEAYLRARGYPGPIHDTVRFLPARGEYPPAMICAFGFPREVEPGVIHIAAEAIRGVHLTRLLPTGADRQRGNPGGEPDKKMVGLSRGWPIVLTPPNDLFGLAIAEGIEDALSIHQATGVEAWATGGAGRMPVLAEVVPGYVESVTVIADDDDTGRENARDLVSRLRARGIEARIWSDAS